MIDIADYIAAWNIHPMGNRNHTPWQVTANAAEIICIAIGKLTKDYTVDGAIAIHASAKIETGAVVKGPALIGPGCQVGANAYLRGGVYLASRCVVGPGCELKTSFLFDGSQIAHLSFVGDSLIGANVNLEAGAIIANHRNELADKQIRIHRDHDTIDTGVNKFGSLIGDGVCIGANAVIAPGALLKPGAVVPRLGLVDQSP